MKQQYCNMPDIVEVHQVSNGTDVILRKNIEQAERMEDGRNVYSVYECDEVQFRYPGTLTKAQVEADFDSWWDYDPVTDGGGDMGTDTAGTYTIEQQITDLQIALCEVYELLT